MKVILIFLGGLAALLIGTLALNKQQSAASVEQHLVADTPMPPSSQVALPQASLVESNKGSVTQNLNAFYLNFTVKDDFDKFIFDRQETAPELVIAHFNVYAKETFSDDTESVATDLFERYVRYKVALSDEDIEVDMSLSNLRDVAYKLEERELLRREYFSDVEYYYLFSQDAQIDQAALDRLQIAQEKTLDKSQRQALIFAQIENASDAEKHAFKPTVDMHKIQQIKRTHTSLNARYNAVAAEFGHEVAERFRKTWQAQSSWDERVKAYESYRQSIGNKGLNSDVVKQQIVDYEKAHFSANELKRLRVITSLQTAASAD